jgi:tetratricopeptide (TPR) repeat protein
MGSGGSAAAPVDLSTMSLEQQGMVLFDRVMRSASAGDSADVAFFLPKALVVHEQIDPDDADGIFHFALLYLTGGDFDAALAKAEEGLERTPDHLLLLGASGEAAVGSGDLEAAREYYSRYLEVYDVEMGLMRSGYEHHQPLFPVYLEEARAFLGGG